MHLKMKSAFKIHCALPLKVESAFKIHCAMHMKMGSAVVALTCTEKWRVLSKFILICCFLLRIHCALKICLAMSLTIRDTFYLITFLNVKKSFEDRRT